MSNKQEIQYKIIENKERRESSSYSLAFYKERVDLYNKELMELEKQLKECDELKLVGGYAFGRSIVVSDTYATKEVIETGRCYPNRDLAEIAMNNSNTRNKLEAYSRIIDPDWREDFDQVKTHYFIYKYIDEYRVGADTSKHIGSVYMAKSTATRIAEALNNSEITL